MGHILGRRKRDGNVCNGEKGGGLKNRKKDLYSKYDKTCEKGYIFVALKYYTLWYSEFEDELFIS